MNILLVGWHSAPVPFFVEYGKALEALGHTVTYFDDRKVAGIYKGYNYPDLIRDITNNTIDTQIHQMERELKELIYNNVFDCCFVETGKLFRIEFVKWLTDHLQTIMLCIDDCYDWLGKYVAEYYSAIITMDHSREFLQHNSNTFEQNLVGLLSHHQKLDLPKELDITFIGTAYPERKRIVNFLVNHGMFVNCFGTGWDTHTLGQGQIHNPTMLAKIINISKIVLHIHRPEQVGVNLRFYETIGCGTFLLTNYAPDKMYGYVQWKDEFQLLDYCIHYLENDRIREYIAQVGYRHIHEHYQLTAIMNNVIELLSNEGVI